MSSLAWIDFDSAERERMQRVLAFFQERESRDELGLGAIRDSIADHLFPGTSTIQTRLRYMLFIPWLFQRLRPRDVSVEHIRREARAMEIRLIDALKQAGESDGIIGSRAGTKLQRLPSLAYWAGMGAWGIRLFPGSPESYFASLRNVRRSSRSGEDDQLSGALERGLLWNPCLPPEPASLLDRAVFQMTPDEAEFIVDRLIANQPSALLTLLARERVHAECDYIWMHPDLADLPTKIRSLIGHAQVFSDLMHGAALLYNLTISEARAEEDWIDRYRNDLAQWADELDMSAVRAWSLPAFWESVAHPAHVVQPAAKRFVSLWLDLVLRSGRSLVTSDEARRLIEERERRLKGANSRYANRSALDRWGGASGARRLGFRWAQARTYLGDLADAA